MANKKYVKIHIQEADIEDHIPYLFEMMTQTGLNFSFVIDESVYYPVDCEEKH